MKLRETGLESLARAEIVLILTVLVAMALLHLASSMAEASTETNEHTKNLSPETNQLIELNLTERVETYLVYGNSPGEIIASMMQNKPAALTTDAVANTNYSIDATYISLLSLSCCRLGSGTLNLDITYVIPELDTDNSALTTELLTEWELYHQYAIEHETMHGTIAKQCAENMIEALEEIPSQSSCWSLQDTIDALLRAEMDVCETEQERFDSIYGDASLPLGAEDRVPVDFTPFP